MVLTKNSWVPPCVHQDIVQGIGLFDGIFVDWVIENNLVVADHWHGITVMGARNVRIVNNTVVDQNEVSPGPPWITITRHKDGRPPQDSLIANNLATSFNIYPVRRNFPATDPGVQMRNNVLVERPGQVFRDPAAFDFRLRADSTAIDAGSAELAPDRDIEGTRRPAGGTVDAGAFERQ